jgi:hypothetical protein
MWCLLSGFRRWFSNSAKSCLPSADKFMAKCILKKHVYWSHCLLNYKNTTPLCRYTISAYNILSEEVPLILPVHKRNDSMDINTSRTPSHGQMVECVTTTQLKSCRWVLELTFDNTQSPYTWPLENNGNNHLYFSCLPPCLTLSSDLCPL